MFAYEIEDLVMKYNNQARPANDHITLQIEEGEIFVLLGPNGAGKTTLIKQMVNLIKPTGGVIKLFGKPLAYTPMYAPQLIGYVPQNGQSLSDLTVDESLYFSAHLRGLSRKDALNEQERLVQLFGLKSIRSSVIHRLSGGQKRLILLAMTMAASPKVLILDEPTNDLDPEYRHLVWKIIEDINQRQGATVILVTHNLLEAEKVAHRIGIMRDGKMFAVGRSSELKQKMNRKICLEVVFSEESPPQFLANLPLQESMKGRRKLLIERTEMPTYVDYLLSDGVESFYLSTPTLEDLYLEMMKR